MYRWLRRQTPVAGGFGGFFGLCLVPGCVLFWLIGGVSERGRQQRDQRDVEERRAAKEAKKFERLGRMHAELSAELNADPRTALTTTTFEPPLTNEELAAQDLWETECDMCRSCALDLSEDAEERACLSFCQIGDHGPLVETYVGSGCLCKDGWHRWDRSHCYRSPSFDCAVYGFDKKTDPRFGFTWHWKKQKGWAPGVCRWRRDAS